VSDDTYNANPASMRSAVQIGDWRPDGTTAVWSWWRHDVGVRAGKCKIATPKRHAKSPNASPHGARSGIEFARVFESLREALGGRLITAPDADALGRG